ncbi:4Fe-4S dicluster domain-containing protein [Clostridiaceae bacterium HSG29]|nr:4Fe-4S dicluster domain-containing protein [Clostridiaceae bacterium HSG29]
MRIYDNEVQKIKSEVLREVAFSAFNKTLEEDILGIPSKVNPGPKARYRCCIYHERAVTVERVQMAIGGNNIKSQIVEVLDSACDKCLVYRFVVTETCRGCLANRCIKSCPVDAIQMVNSKAVIDQSKCIECGKCKSACPYGAIADVMRPCKRGCPTNAIKIDENKKAVIDYKKCISCGACVYQCPFGAMQEKSEIVSVINDLMKENNDMYAILAPSFATQFDYVELGKVISGIKSLGFRDVIEVALGADLIINHEATELLEFKSEKKVLTSSCCPGFVNYIYLKYPELKDSISSTVSPMVATARLIKKIDKNAKIVFVGPCIAKKSEKLRVEDVDYVLTFEELAAMIDAKDIDLENHDAMPLNNASYFGRKFAATGGVTLAIKNFLDDKGIDDVTIETCDGINECDKALKLLKFNRLNADFIEGMACKGGCIKGPATMHHGAKDIKSIDAYSKKAKENNYITSTKIFENINMSI